MANNNNKGFSICAPSLVYLFLSLISILLSILFGIRNFMTIIQFICTIFWTWVLNLICKAGYTWVSWILVLLPFIIILLIILYFIFSLKYNKYEINQYYQDLEV